MVLGPRGEKGGRRELSECREVLRLAAMRLQFDEAFALLSVVTDYREQMPEPRATGTTESRNLFRLAVAEREVLGFTSFWLGLTRPLEHWDPDSLSKVFDSAVEDERAPYKVAAPRRLLSLLEDVSRGINVEKRTEGRRISPRWWRNHLASRHMAAILCEGVSELIKRTESILVAPLMAASDLDAQVVAVRVFELLELIHKVLFHMQLIRSAYGRLEALRHAPSDDELWPELPAPEDQLREFEEQLIRRLAGVAPALATEAYDPSQPDLFGQAYRLLFDAAFEAVIGARVDLATVLFPMTIEVAERARMRLGTDLSDQRQREQVMFGTEPYVDMMELSGCALLMAHVEPPVIGGLVTRVWDAIFVSTGAPDLLGILLAVLDFQENTLALTAGGIGRTQRQREFAQMMRSRGIVRRDGMWGEEEDVGHADPIVAVFAPDDMMGLYHNLADVFVVEYLLARPEVTGHTIARRVEQLQDSIEFERERHERADGGGADDETPS